MHIQACGIQYVLYILAVCVGDTLTGDLCNEMLKEKIMRILIRMVGNDCIGVAAACSLALAEFAKHGK